ncbi:putative carboxylesterase 18 [Iris pallida]|uniref:Carboxylesterase 18 n=1 Tax=Iris pallida TaxID=29817 RepID=A0AAX6HY37_IRIPA|nr:putative carboxylesterase 18 [Iris pallida]
MGMGVDEVLHLLQEYPSLLGVREYVEGVGGLPVLHQPHLLPPPPQPLRVPPLPVLERVPPSHHHHRRRVPLLQLLRVVRPEHVAGLVVPVGPLRQEGSPQPIRPRDRHERRLRQPQLRLRPLLPAEVGLYHHQARQLQALPPPAPAQRRATWWTMFPPALSPTRKVLERSASAMSGLPPPFSSRKRRTSRPSA